MVALRWFGLVVGAFADAIWIGTIWTVIGISFGRSPEALFYGTWSVVAGVLIGIVFAGSWRKMFHHDAQPHATAPEQGERER